MTLYLVRHGRAAAGVEDLDPGLDDAGYAQTKATAAFFAGRNVSRLVVSPLRRTRETADPIASALGLVAEVRDGVAEVFDPTMSSEERRAMIVPFMAGNWADQPDGLRAWRKRVVETLLEIGLATEGANTEVVVVSHYIAIGVAIGAATGDDRVVPAPIANASISSFSAGHGGLRLLEAGSTAHLSAELVTGVHTAILGSAAGQAPG